MRAVKQTATTKTAKTTITATRNKQTQNKQEEKKGFVFFLPFYYFWSTFCLGFFLQRGHSNKVGQSATKNITHTHTQTHMAGVAWPEIRVVEVGAAAGVREDGGGNRGQSAKR